MSPPAADQSADVAGTVARHRATVLRLKATPPAPAARLAHVRRFQREGEEAAAARRLQKREEGVAPRGGRREAAPAPAPATVTVTAPAPAPVVVAAPIASDSTAASTATASLAPASNASARTGLDLGVRERQQLLREERRRRVEAMASERMAREVQERDALERRRARRAEEREKAARAKAGAGAGGAAAAAAAAGQDPAAISPEDAEKAKAWGIMRLKQKRLSQREEEAEREQEVDEERSQSVHTKQSQSVRFDDSAKDGYLTGDDTTVNTEWTFDSTLAGDSRGDLSDEWNLCGVHADDVDMETVTDGVRDVCGMVGGAALTAKDRVEKLVESYEAEKENQTSSSTAAAATSSSSDQPKRGSADPADRAKAKIKFAAANPSPKKAPLAAST